MIFERLYDSGLQCNRYSPSGTYFSDADVRPHFRFYGHSPRSRSFAVRAWHGETSASVARVAGTPWRRKNTIRPSRCTSAVESLRSQLFGLEHRTFMRNRTRRR